MAKRDDAIRQGMAGYFGEGDAPATAAAPTTPAAPARKGRPGTDAPAASRRVQITAYLDPAEAAALEAAARREDRSVAYIVRVAVRKYLGLK